MQYQQNLMNTVYFHKDGLESIQNRYRRLKLQNKQTQELLRGNKTKKTQKVYRNTHK